MKNTNTPPVMERFIDKLLVMPNGCWDGTLTERGVGPAVLDGEARGGQTPPSLPRSVSVFDQGAC